MTDPDRLLDVGDPFERELLGSARRDHGSKAAEARCIVAATAAAAVATHVGGAAASTALASTASTALGAAGVGAGIAIKAVVIGFALGLGVQGAVAVKNHVSKAPTAQTAATFAEGAMPRPAASASVPLPAAVATQAFPEQAAQVPASDETAPQSDAPAVEAFLTRPKATSRMEAKDEVARAPMHEVEADAEVTSPAPAPANDALDREVALIDEARLASRASSYAQALSLLDRHQRDFPRGVLGPEALVIRVQALIGLGRRAEAERLALPFMANYVNSPITRRLRAILGSAQSSK